MYLPGNPRATARYRKTLLATIGAWLLAGTLLLLTGLVQFHSALLGWSLPFWLVLAPLLLTLTLEPGLPGHWLRRRRSRRRGVRDGAWC